MSALLVPAETTSAAPFPVHLTLPLALIDPSPTNPRKHFDEAKLAELAESIREHGILQPILVRPRGERYELIAGERRYRAAKRIELAEVPVVIKDLDDKQTLEVQVVENLQRDDLHPLEEAEGYARLLREHGYSADLLADRIKKSRSYVYQRIKLIELCDAGKDALYAGEITHSVALLIARIPDVKLQEAALEHVSLDPRTEEPLSYRDAEDYIHNEFMLRLADAPFSTKDATLVPGVSSCRECPLRTGNQEELFADVGSKDVCTSPPCYHSKVEAHLRKIAEKEDADVLTVAKAQKVFGKYGTPTGGFIDLDRTDWRLSDSGKKVRELVGGEAKKVLAFSGGKVHELVREKDLPDRLKKKIETAKSRTSLQSNTISPEKKKEIERERAAAEAVSEAVRAAAVAAVLDPKRKLKLDALLMPLAAAVSVDREWYFCREVLPRLGVSKKKKPDAVIRTQASEIIATVKKMTAAQQMAVLVELLFFTSEYGDPEDLAAARDELLKSLAVDEDAVCGRVEAELKSKWAAEDAKEKSAPVAAAKKVDPAKKQKPAAAATGKKTAGGKKK